MKDLIAATPDLVRWMEDIRLVKKRLGILSRYTEFLELLEKAVERMRSKAPLGSAFPRTADVAMLPETKSLAETVVPDRPSHHSGNKVSGVSERKRLSKTLAAHVPTLLDYWREYRREQLIGLITSLAVPVRHLPQDPLNLALAVFRCRECSAVLRWPAVLSHPHLYTCDNASQGSVGRPEPGHGTVICGLSITDDVFDSAIRRRFRSSSQWTSSRLEFRGEEISRIISACGSDPTTADGDELDRIDARLACSLCSESNQRVLAMGWRAAISHAFESSQLAAHTTASGPVFWTRVDSRLERVLKTVAAAQPSATRASSTANAVSFPARAADWIDSQAPGSLSLMQKFVRAVRVVSPVVLVRRRYDQLVGRDRRQSYRIVVAQLQRGAIRGAHAKEREWQERPDKALMSHRHCEEGPQGTEGEEAQLHGDAEGSRQLLARAGPGLHAPAPEIMTRAYSCKPLTTTDAMSNLAENTRGGEAPPRSAFGGAFAGARRCVQAPILPMAASVSRTILACGMWLVLAKTVTGALTVVSVHIDGGVFVMSFASAHSGTPELAADNEFRMTAHGRLSCVGEELWVLLENIGAWEDRDDVLPTRAEPAAFRGVESSTGGSARVETMTDGSEQG
ncbi:hypothetical protein FOMPIDRAFT_116472 [Fomitopsis schrenkii]|uniref:Uncharacterized protein n=1 Tax=Fomitopsis schrenkii TaxID=2126942 RepID=S8F1P0_FOMSC|nr:hypothetical protein FOMPIDRAFT_116472 [Fomitopsis schrenkii]